MAPTKLAKVQAEIDKASGKLAEQQRKIKTLEDKHTKLENQEIIEIVRRFDVTLESLPEILKAGSKEKRLIGAGTPNYSRHKTKPGALKSSAEESVD